MVVYGASESSNCVSSLLDRTFISAITAVSSQARIRQRARGGKGIEVWGGVGEHEMTTESGVSEEHDK
jgi:hypothetical protein